MVEEASAQPQVYECAKHPGRQTSLRCGRCEKPICVKCIVQTPVGARCRECARVRTLPIYQAGMLTLAKAGFVGLLIAALSFTFLFVFFRGFALWLSPLVGLGVGETMSLSANRKRAPALQATAVAAVVLGALLADVAQLYLLFGRVTAGLVVQTLASNLLVLSISVFLAAILAMGRLR